MENYTIEEVINFVEENDVKFIRLAFVDILGNHKNISIMPDELRTAFSTGIRFNSYMISGFKDENYSDLYLKPDPDTLSVLPWRPQQGRVIRFYCDVVQSDGSAFIYDTRKFLRDTLQAFADINLSCRIGLKSEFYLFQSDEYGNPTNIPWDEGGYLDISPLDKGENIRREICLCLEEMGIQPESSHHEAGPGQNEIDFKASDALGSADNYITYKNVVSSISASNGIYASFDPKPIKGECGNGLHMGLSLYQNGISIDEIDPNITDNFMGGVLNRMRDITLFLNSQDESYNRFGENEAPKYITYSSKNHSRLLRIRKIKDKRVSFELRSPDSSLNPYLAIAMVIRAGLAGIKNKEQLPNELDTDKGLMSEEELAKLDKLPMSIDEAIECAKNSSFLQDSACKEIANRFIEVIEHNK